MVAQNGPPGVDEDAREAYLRSGVPPESRHVIINYQRDSPRPYLECIDFVGISGADLETHYLEWANPDAAGRGLTPGMAEGGQGSGGKAYLRQMFEDGFFASVAGQRLSVVKFTDARKFNLYFVPDAESGRDATGENRALPLRATCAAWLKGYDQPATGNITIVRGILPRKSIDIRPPCRRYTAVPSSERNDQDVSGSYSPRWQVRNGVRGEADAAPS